MALPSSNLPSEPTHGQKVRNFAIVLVAVVLSILLGLGLQQQSARPSLAGLAETATPLEEAIANGKPSLVEFYANWCTSCQAMVADMAALKAIYADRVNFVMLNVDNSKWLPELMRYRVDGIPHFIFLDKTGTAIASAVGEQPRPILDSRLTALVAGADLSGQMSVGQTSTFEPNLKAKNGDDPRQHGAGVSPGQTAATEMSG